MKLLRTIIALSLLTFFSCNQISGDESNSANTVVNNYNYIVAEFQNDALPHASYTGCLDTYVLSGVPDSNNGTAATCTAGLINTGNIARYLLKFDVSAIPSGVKVYKAFLTLKVTNSTVSGGTIDCHRYTMSWISSSSWNNTLGAKYYDAAVAGKLVFNGNKYYSIQLEPAVVQGWINDSSQNFGLLLKGNNEDAIENLTCNSTDDAQVANRPKLTVYYTLQ